MQIQGALLNCLGYTVNDRVLAGIYRFKSYSGSSWNNFDNINIIDFFIQIALDTLRIYGYRNKKIFSLNSLLNILLFLLIGAAVLIIINRTSRFLYGIYNLKPDGR